MDAVPTYAIVIVACGMVGLCCCTACICFFRWFKIDRRKAQRVSVNIRYYDNAIPNFAKEEVVISRDRKRGKKLESRVLEVQPISAKSTIGFDDDDSDTWDRKSAAGSKGGKAVVDIHEMKSSFRPFRWLSERISSSKSRRKLPTTAPGIDDADVENNIHRSTVNGSTRGLNSKISSKKNLATNSSLEEDSSSKKKRFVSEDRLRRIEARKALLNGPEAVVEADDESEEVYVPETVASLLDIEPLRKQRVKSVIEQRLTDRREAKQLFFSEGGIDVVGLNSGPSSFLVPDGYRLNDEIGEKLLTPEFLVYKRVLFLWEKAAKADGWYIGTIVRTSTAPGFNYQIKYDREETKNIFVDGVHAVDLQLHGENAYGRRWVLLLRTAPGRFSKAIS